MQATVAHICCHHRPRYMELLKKHRLALQKNSKASIDSRELDEITVMEALLPLQALVVFRQLVAKEVILLQHRGQLEKEKSKTTRRMSSFFKSHFGAKKKVSGDEVEDHGGDEEEEDISIQVVSERCVFCGLFYSLSLTRIFSFSVALVAARVRRSHAVFRVKH